MFFAKLYTWRYFQYHYSFWIYEQGFEIDVNSGKAFADSLDKAVVPENLYFNVMLRILATRCMMQAVYFCSGMISKDDYLHYGLATPIYTHFTSPIRRLVTELFILRKSVIKLQLMNIFYYIKRQKLVPFYYKKSVICPFMISLY